jgi:hypothetical protein
MDDDIDNLAASFIEALARQHDPLDALRIIDVVNRTVGELMDDLRLEDPDGYANLTEHILWGDGDNG